MAPKRSPERDKAFHLWRDSNKTIPHKDIAEQLGIAETLVRKWKCQDKWNEKIISNATNEKSNVTNKISGKVTNMKGAPKGNKNAVGHGAPKENKNAIGNKGGNGGPLCNKNALTTGEYETIWFDCLTKEEQVLCSAINTDILMQMEEGIRLLTIRERRMMERIKQLMGGLSEKERNVLHELQVQKNPVEVYDEKTGQSKVVVVPEAKMVITEIRVIEYRVIDDIIKLEESLNRVQEKKSRLLMNKHKVGYENEVLNIRKKEIELKSF